MQTLLCVSAPSYLSVCIFINPLFIAKLKPFCMVTGQIFPLSEVFCAEDGLPSLSRSDRVVHYGNAERRRILLSLISGSQQNVQQSD